MLAVASPVAPSASTPAHHIHHAPLPRTPYSLELNTMLPSPPGTNPFFAPLSPPAGDGLDLEPSPSYSPLSSPSQSPRPPPSPPLAPFQDQTTEYRERLREQRLRDQQAREKALQKVRELAPTLLAQQQHQQHPQGQGQQASHSSPQQAYQSTGPASAGTPAASEPTVGAPATPAPSASPLAAPALATTQENVMQSSDSIALRSTLRLLTLQRERARRDISELESLREAALKEPLQFVEYVQASKRRNPTTGRPATADLKNNIFAGKEIPKAQEVYRCPPIEWSKYQIIGAPLDSLHNQQRNRPSPSRPAVPQSMQTGGIIGFPTGDYADLDSGLMQGHLRLFDGIGCVGR